jgi:flagellar hook-basal body complex protein FliE
MDALSALRLAAMPAFGARTPAGMPTPETIAPAELSQLPPGVAVAEPSRAASPASFEQVLGRMVGEVNARQTEAGEAVRGLLSGQEVSLHQAMIKIEEASVSFQLMVEVRNKLLESYQELMRMQV